MGETITNAPSYVDGYKVVSNTETTVTLENGVTVDKSRCKYICTDFVDTATYYRYQED